MVAPLTRGLNPPDLKVSTRVSRLIDHFPKTPNEQYRRVTLPNYGFCDSKLVEDVCGELERSALINRASDMEPTAVERFVAWVLDGNVRSGDNVDNSRTS